MTDVYVILLPQLGISVFLWIQLILPMNRYRGLCRFTRHDMWALLLFLHGGFVRWIAASRPAHLVAHLPDHGRLSRDDHVVDVLHRGLQRRLCAPLAAAGRRARHPVFITILWEVGNRLVFDLDYGFS